jgi:mannose-6-phosphate isomerase-like protein (cupin superfamily)
MKRRTKIAAEEPYRKDILEDHRPWGKFRAYPTQRARHVKIITVNPDSSLSLQLHKRRSEFWVVLDGGLEITVGPKVWRPAAGEEIFIPSRTPHRLRCLGRKPARVMEIWLGSSSESDIVRIEDQYGRNR